MSQNTHSQHQWSGFSLFELIAVISIVATLAFVALPSFANLLARNQVSIHTNQVLESLLFARSQALNQQQTIHVCRLSPPQNCHDQYKSNADWSAGWLIFADLNSNNNFDTNDKLLRHILNDSSVNIVFNQHGRLRFFADGSARSAGFYICDKQQRQYRHIYLFHSGRARINDQLDDNKKQICDSVK